MGKGRSWLDRAGGREGMEGKGRAWLDRAGGREGMEGEGMAGQGREGVSPLIPTLLYSTTHGAAPCHTMHTVHFMILGTQISNCGVFVPLVSCVRVSVSHTISYHIMLHHPIPLYPIPFTDCMARTFT